MVSIRDLGFRYSGGENFALDGITLEINRGDFLGLIGPSGAGKSTLAFALCGIVPHRCRGDFYGSVTVGGLDTVTSSPEEIAHHVGCVFQDIEGQLLATVVEDEILFGLENFGTPRGEIEERMEYALDAAGISGLRHRTIPSLSGGQKQKVAIASIIALRPDVIVLDEPTGELDPRSSRRVFETLRELNERHGITVIVIEQKIMILCEFARRLAVMDGGRIAVEGPVRDVLSCGERLEEAGVNIPRVATLARTLRERGHYDGPTPLNLAEASAMVRESVRYA
ncbi:MAG: ATP-binding cassette domain-containing protein [Synergistaceae bacterium]|jgi:energy-coupling factor transport system ATP-binding protein|nr:ATP-binding cassette domain-containing protein [Synergistaceae bacterium]